MTSVSPQDTRAFAWHDAEISFSQAQKEIAKKALEGINSDSHLGFSDLLRSFYNSKVSGDLPLCPPQSISLSRLASTFEALSLSTLNDGLERGRYGFIDLNTKELVLGITATGDPLGVTISREVCAEDQARRLHPIFVIHTHEFDGKTHSFHFSENDIAEFLSDQTALADFVVVHNKVIMTLKTEATVKEPNPETRGLLRMIYSSGRLDYWSKTQEACRILGLSLYAMEIKDPYIAQRIV